MAKRKIAIALTIVFLAVVVCFAVLAWYVNSARFKLWLLGMANQNIAGRIVVADLGIDLLQGRITLSDGRLLGVDEALLAQVKRLEMSLSWAALLKREIRVTGLTIDGLRLDLIFDARDNLTLGNALVSPGAEPSTGETQAPDWNLRIDDFNLHDGQVYFQQQSKALEARLESLEIKAGGDLRRRNGEAQIAMGSIQYRAPGVDRVLEDIVVQAAYREEDARPWQIKIKTRTSQAAMLGRVRGGVSNPELDAVVETDLDLTEVQPWIPLDLDLRGRLKAKLLIKGPAADPRVSLDLEIRRASGLGIEVEDLSTQVKLDQRRVTLDSLSARGPWGGVDLKAELDLQPAFPAGFLEPAAGFEAVVSIVSLAVRDIEPWHLPGLPGDWIGTWQGRADLRGRGLPGSARYQGQGELDLSVAGIELMSGARRVNGGISARLAWDRFILDVQQCRASIPSHELQARGRIDFDRMQLDAGGRLVSENIQYFGEALGVPLPRGRAQVKVAASGALDSPALKADVLAQEVRWDSFSFGRVLVSADLDPRLNLNFSRIVVENQGSYLEGKGRMVLAEVDPGIFLELDLDPAESKDFFDSGTAAALIRGHLSVTGSINDPRARFRLDPSLVSWEGYQARVQGSVTWQAGRLTIPALDLSGEESAIHFSGHVAWQDPRSGRWLSDPLLELKARSGAFQLKDIFPQMQGKLALDAAFSGPSTRPAGRFKVEGRQLDLGYQTLHQVKLEGRLADQVIHIEEFSLGLTADQQIRATGWYALDQRFEIHLAGADLDLAQVQAVQKGLPVQGRLDLEVRGSGSLKEPSLTAVLAVRDPFFGGRPLEPLNVKADLTGRRLHLVGDLSFDLEADCDVSTGDFSFAAAFDQTDLSPLLSIMGAAKFQAGLSGKAAASGNWNDWRRMRATADVSRAELSHDGRRLVTLPGLNLELRDGVMRLADTRLDILQQGYLKLAAKGDTAQGVQASAEGQIPLAALTPFIGDDQEAAGALNIQARVQGPWDRLQWQLDLTLDQAGYEIPYLSQNLHDVNGKVQLTADHITIAGLSGRIDEGGFALDGRIELKGFQPTQGQVILKLDALPLEVPDTLDLVLGGELGLKGSPEQALLEGNLILLEGSYYKNLRLNLLSLVTETRRSRIEPRIGEQPEWLHHIRLNVGISYRHPFEVDNNVARLEIAPDLSLGGTLARPILTGRAAVTEGEVIFRGFTFPVTRGVVDFINPNKIEPDLDILTETQIRQWQVTLALTGTPDDLVVKLTSDPALPESDILSLILFGSTSTELTSGDGDGELVDTRKMMASLLASTLGEDVKKTTGVDILELDTGAKKEEDSEDRIQVTVGKKFSPRMTVKYEVESNNGEMIQRAVSEYRFSGHMSASGFQDSKGAYGGELLFRFEFQ